MNEECLICKAPLEYLDKDEKCNVLFATNNNTAKQNAKTDILFVTNATRLEWTALLLFVLKANRPTQLKF